MQLLSKLNKNHFQLTETLSKLIVITWKHKISSNLFCFHHLLFCWVSMVIMMFNHGDDDENVCVKDGEWQLRIRWLLWRRMKMRRMMMMLTKNDGGDDDGEWRWCWFGERRCCWWLTTVTEDWWWTTVVGVCYRWNLFCVVVTRFVLCCWWWTRSGV